MTKDTPITIALAIIATLAVLVLWFTHREPVQESARIGGTEVPALNCEEDEIIAFDSSKPAPFPLDCIHIDTFGG